MSRLTISRMTTTGCRSSCTRTRRSCLQPVLTRRWNHPERLQEDRERTRSHGETELCWRRRQPHQALTMTVRRVLPLRRAAVARMARLGHHRPHQCEEQHLPSAPVVPGLTHMQQPLFRGWHILRSRLRPPHLLSTSLTTYSRDWTSHSPRTQYRVRRYPYPRTYHRQRSLASRTNCWRI